MLKSGLKQRLLLGAPTLPSSEQPLQPRFLATEPRLRPRTMIWRRSLPTASETAPIRLLVSARSAADRFKRQIISAQSVGIELRRHYFSTQDCSTQPRSNIIRYSLFVAALTALFLAGCNFTLAADVTPPPGYSPPPTQENQDTGSAGLIYAPVPPNPASGMPIYTEKCAPCHGAGGLGNGPRAAQLPNPVPAIGSPEVARLATPSQWYTIVTQGNLEKFMPPFSSLTERQRWDVVAYALSLSTNPDDLSLAAELYTANCASCHGVNGEGDGSQAPGVVSDFTSQEYMANKSSTDLYQTISNGAAPGMPAFGDQLSDAERWALSDYIRTFSFAGNGNTEAAETASSTPIPETADVQVTPGIAVTEVITPGLGTIQGSVTNATSGSAAAELEIALHAFQDMTLVYSDTTKTKSDGTFAFENIEMPEGRVFFTSTEFQDMVYRSERGDAQAGVTSLDLPIQVYESTTDPSNLSVDRLHIFLEFLDEATLRISELYVASNLDTKTLVASQAGGPVLTYNLPEGATNLQFQDGMPTSRFVATDEGFGDLLPVVPGLGNYQLLYSYELPYDRKLNFSQTMALATKAVLVAIPEDGVKIKGATLTDAGSLESQDGTFHIYNGTGIDQGGVLEMTISGKPSTGASISTSSSTGLVIGIAALGLAFVVAGVWLYRRNQPVVEGEIEDEPIEPNGKSSESSETVMDSILALDDLYKEGMLPEEAYLERRAELKAHLKELLDREQG